MLLIWGLRVLYRKLSEGAFHCPSCEADRQYRLRQGRRWFTLFFVPLIPLNKVGGEFVECATCKSTYKPEVLTLPTTGQLATALPSCMRAVAAVVLHAGGAADRVARDRAVTAIVDAGAVGFGEADLDADLARPVAAAHEYVASVADGLAMPGRERFLAEGARIAVADGPLDGAERQALLDLGQRLGLSFAHASGVIATVADGRQAHAE